MSRITEETYVIPKQVSTFTGEELTLYLKTSSGLRRIWSSTLHNKFGRWVREDVDLTPINADRFTVLFYTHIGTWCRSAVGLDNIIFHTCPVGKFEICRKYYRIRIYVYLSTFNFACTNFGIIATNVTWSNTYNIVWYLNCHVTA